MGGGDGELGGGKKAIQMKRRALNSMRDERENDRSEVQQQTCA
jgi:hypothetical protein